MKILYQKEVQQIEFNHSFYIEFNALMDIYNKCINKPYLVSVNDTTLKSDR